MFQSDQLILTRKGEHQAPGVEEALKKMEVEDGWIDWEKMSCEPRMKRFTLNELWSDAG